MRSRWITLLGRTGSILIALGLASVLVSAIPPRSLLEMGPWRFTSRPEKYDIIHAGAYLPQKGCRILIATNDSLQIYFLAAHPLQLLESIKSWIKEHFPTLNETQVLMRWEASVLEAFLQTRPEDILLKETVKGERSIDFFPPKATNVTVLVSNPSLMPVDVNRKITVMSTVVPRGRIATTIEVLTALGVALALPWTVKKSKDYVRSR